MNVASRNTVRILGVAVLLGAVGAVLFLRRENPSPDPPKRTGPAPSGVFERIRRDVARVESESVAESVDKLGEVNLFYWPGPSPEGGSVVLTSPIPLAKDVGQRDLDAIMSNRRFRKVHAALSKLDKAAASQMLNRALSSALDESLKLYESEFNRVAPHYDVRQIESQQPLAGPVFAIDNVPPGQATVAGARLKALSLVWLAGMLRLDDSRNLVERTARAALKQRADLYNETNLHPFFKSQMLSRAGLYNRQILGSALLGVAANPDVEASLLEAAGAEWLTRDLASYKSEVTEFDLPVISGVRAPDYSLGRQQVTYLSPLDDDAFDRVWDQMQAKSDAKLPKPEESKVAIDGGVPIQRGRIDAYINIIKEETLEQSIKNLGLHEDLVEGAGLVSYVTLPFPRAMERCLANRRLAKVFEAFSKLPEKERCGRSKEIFDMAMSDFASACNLILDRWENGDPPTEVDTLFGPGRSVDGYLWALRGAELLCAQTCSAAVALENHDRIEQLRRTVKDRVQRKPEVLAMPYSEIDQLLQPDLIELDIARIVFERHFDSRVMDRIVPSDMVPEKARFYASDAHTNEQDFTHQHRGVPADADRILHTFPVYQDWVGEMRYQSEPRRLLVDQCWDELAKKSQ